MPSQLNWNGYYAEFARIHGGEPVVYGKDPETGAGGRLLFRDGWCFSPGTATEFPPADLDDYRAKVAEYWNTRKSVLTQEYQTLRETIVNTAALQDKRSAPLVVSTYEIRENEEGRKVSKHITGPVNFKSLLERLSILFDQIQECDIGVAAKTEPEPFQSPNLSAMILAEIEAIEARNKK